jgi:LmbE family N-acetylglucosaminyl deacetylase
MGTPTWIALFWMAALTASGPAHGQTATAPAPATPPTERSGGDDRYQFATKFVTKFARASGTEAAEVTATGMSAGVRVTWKAPVKAGWDTALLGLRVEAQTATADPWLELTAGGQRITIYLERGARGLRWLNISGLRAALAVANALEITAHNLRVTPGPTALRLFTNRPPATGALLILAPHPDDAEIAAFGLYASWPAGKVTIVTVTAGNAGDANYRDDVRDPAEQYALKGMLRAHDSVTVPWQGGVPPQRCLNLGYFDARLQEMHDQPGAVVAEMYGPNTDVARYRRVNLSPLLSGGPRTSTWNHLVQDLEQIFRKVRPAVVVMPHPILDGHSDHQYVTIAAVQALQRWNQPATFLLYTNHAGDNRYPHGPAAANVSLPPWTQRSLAIQGVYAHPLPPALRVRKLYALESMHDLRLSPTEQTCPPGPRREDYPRIPDFDYFRRGPRPEELFFVHDRSGVQAIVRDFLANPPPP